MRAARARRDELVSRRAKLDLMVDATEFDRLGELISFEEELIASLSENMARRKSRAPSKWTVSSKGLLQLFVLTVAVFILVGLKRYLW